MSSSDVAVTTPLITATQLREIDLDNVENVLADVYPELIDETSGEIALPDAADEIGDGFSVTKEKDQLIGIPVFIVNYQFSVGDFEKDDGSGDKGEFVTVWAVSMRGKHKFSDGSTTGIYHQLREYFDRTKRTYLRCPNGLRRSEYPAKDAAGRDIRGVTHYIDTSR